MTKSISLLVLECDPMLKDKGKFLQKEYPRCVHLIKECLQIHELESVMVRVQDKLL